MLYNVEDHETVSRQQLKKKTLIFNRNTQRRFAEYVAICGKLPDGSSDA